MSQIDSKDFVHKTNKIFTKTALVNSTKLLTLFIIDSNYLFYYVIFFDSNTLLITESQADQGSVGRPRP